MFADDITRGACGLPEGLALNSCGRSDTSDARVGRFSVSGSLPRTRKFEKLPKDLLKLEPQSPFEELTEDFLKRDRSQDAGTPQSYKTRDADQHITVTVRNMARALPR